jgi:hypothetical protein
MRGHVKIYLFGLLLTAGLLAIAAVIRPRTDARWREGPGKDQARFALADLPDRGEVHDLRAEVAKLTAERAALRQQLGLLERQRADWQGDNPQRPDLAVAPGGYCVTTPAGTERRNADPWPSDDPHEVPIHPCLWPSTREALARWNLWKRDHPDQAKKSLANEAPEELRQARENLRHALGEVEAALGRDTARPHP